MRVIRSIREWQKITTSLDWSQKSVGFVPTMGALHHGHRTLIERCVAENEISVLSVFLNPTQFDNKRDLDKYPASFTEDLEFAKGCGVDFVFCPETEDIYPDYYNYQVLEKELSQRFCGAHRPGHFEGMLTIVLKLFHLVRPQRAYFGEKDFQQLKLVEGMVEAFFLNIEIVPCPIVREVTGLAMSSRNKNLAHPEKAAEFYRVLHTARNAEEAKWDLEEKGFSVDYVEDYQNRRLAAVEFEAVRLIDNVEI